VSTGAQVQARAFATIKRNGAPYVLRREAQKYDANTSTVNPLPRTSWSGYAADWEYERGFGGVLVVVDGIRLIVSAQDMGEPLPGDVAEYAGKKMRVADDGVKIIRMAGVPIAYDVTHERA
jgi:hypothetical protein